MAFDSKPTFIVLLSGDLDSVVNLHLAAQKGRVLMALTFDYGQRAAKREIKSAQFFCQKLKVPHQVIDLTWLKEVTKTALVQRDQDLPELKDLDDAKEGGESAKTVWVPNRNGVFINIAARFAESLNAEFIVPGFNQEEAATFPDNSQSFIDAANGALSLSTMTHAKVKCFTTDLDKSEMVVKAKDLGVEFSHLWSCYRDGEKPCGYCESCQRTARALKRMNIV